jgi:hypothetical protein
MTLHNSAVPRYTPIPKTTRPAPEAVTPSSGRRRPAQGLQKPVPGETRRRKARTAALILLKKTEAKVRDHFRCRFPGCTVQGREFVEAAHLVDAGMGGRPSVSSSRSDYVTLCNPLAPGGGHHRGRRSVHSTHVEMRPLSAAGGDGRMALWTRERLTDPFTYAGETSPVLTDVVRS